MFGDAAHFFFGQSNRTLLIAAKVITDESVMNHSVFQKGFGGVGEWGA